MAHAFFVPKWKEKREKLTKLPTIFRELGNTKVRRYIVLHGISYESALGYMIRKCMMQYEYINVIIEMPYYPI